MNIDKQNESVMAIIPARGGSKGILKKNICLLAGKPLLVYTIEAALNSTVVSKVVVSTDAEDIAEVASNCGVEVIHRPDHLAEDSSLTVPVLKHALQEMGNKYSPDKVVTLKPTSPLRLGTHIDEAVGLLTRDWDAVISVSDVEQTPYKMYYLKGEKLHPFVEGVPQGGPRQKLPKVYRDSGAIYVTWYDVLMEKDSVWGDNYRSYYLAPEYAVDIDVSIDLKLAEAILGDKK